ncbi:MAG: hypothetical protein QOF78_3507, partial [Phycisphaerales bacterium]|nr:hypothetical protein [Phycisphaerales bacterium]
FDVDNVQMARLAVRHLVEQGHRCVGYVGGAYQVSNSRDRWQGFSEACQEVRLECCDLALVKAKGWRLDDAERAQLTEALRRDDRPTAVFAAGYAYALEVYAAAKAAELRIPQDLAVVGVDDPPSAEHLAPPMTTIRQPLMQLGHAAMTALFNSAQESDGQGNETLTSRKFVPELIVRQSSLSVAPAAAAAAAG